jgi:hypothetical protein
MPELSFRQTAPSQGQNSRSFWNETGEGAQYLHQDPLSQGHAQNGFSESLQMIPPGQNNGQSTMGNTRSQWDAELPQTHTESVKMSRYPSQDSTGAHSQSHNSTATHSFDQNRSTRMYPSVSQASFHMSSASSDATGRSHSPEGSALYTPTPMDLQGFESFHFPGGDEFSEAESIFHRSSTAGIASHPSDSFTTGPSFNIYATAGDETFVSLTTGSNHLPVSHDSVMYNPSTINDSPTIWDHSTEFLDSQRSSPTLLEDPWSLPPPQMTSATTSPLDYSPSLEGISPRYVQDFPDMVEPPPYANSCDRVTRKPVGPRQSKVASDSRKHRLNGTSETSDESFKMVGRSSLEIDNTARDHPLYQNVTAQADGFYHCPWEGQDGCQHKPEKLKCNYEYAPHFVSQPLDTANHLAFASKFVDSHLKPYRCKVLACENLHFSSTACLLRHEREAHAMHGHGDKPFLCTYEGCERGVAGNGFPRHWNLRDHMKRVHNDPGQPKSSASGSPPPSGPAKGKKRKAGPERPDSPFLDKAPKRVSTPPVTVRQQPSLMERYHSSEQKLLETVKQLHDPKNVNNMNLLHTADHYIKVMVETTNRINAVPALGENFTQRSSG